MTADEVPVLVVAAGGAAAVGALGTLVLWRWHGRSVRGALVAVAAVSTLSVVAGVVGTARAMFISAHDLNVILPVSVVAGAVGLAVALVLAASVVREVDQVRAAARRLGETGSTDPSDATGTAPPAAPVIRELGEIRAELDRAAARLAEAHRREQALESSRRELIAWVSHDLRTPLAGMRAMAEALEDGVADDPPRYHRQIRREVDRLAALVDDLFELSRIQAGALTLTLRAVDVRELVDDVVAGSRPMAEAGRVTLAAAADPTVVRGDAGALSRVLANLVVNAIRHTPSDGVVHVVGEPDGDHAVITVSDGCGGLSPEELDRVFDTGWRGTAARTPGPDGGAGLGLAIARGIVEAHQGRIAVMNAGAGCRFEVRLPLPS